MGAIIDRFVGRDVIIYSNCGQAEHSDRGHLEAADDHYLVIVNGNGEELVFPANQVREIKINGGRH